MHQPKLGLAMLFGVGFGLLIERAANLLYLGLSRSVDLRTRPYGESDYFRHGGQRHWYFQLRAVGRCT
ncbi:inner membrane protein [Salmonella enterica subsp. enterica]|uniref:Inner membrane protein n=1 Tax=Salmonella enterica I TaxID=59201 RepID=A0A379WRH2_SALET|nr:inner membrane protein [Salmonella enterica subsp. enterica]